MSRDVTVRDLQRAVADIHAWANGSAYLPEAPSDVLRAVANLLDTLLANRETIAGRMEP